MTPPLHSCMAVSLIGASLIFACVALSPPISAPIEECPWIPDCCEEDCCGEGTSWEPPFCVLDQSGPGFNGTHSDTYDNGCVERACCESACCSKGTIYDTSLALCFPLVAPTPSASTTSRPTMLQRQLQVACRLLVLVWGPMRSLSKPSVAPPETM